MTNTVNIVIRDGVAYLDVADPEIWEAIIDSTSFKVEGADYRVRDNRRDKRTKLVRNHKCPIGLLDRVCRSVTLHGVVPQVSYADTQIQPKPHFKMKLFDVEPRDYQDEAALAAMLESRGIFRMPTGSGKTLTCAQIVQVKGMHAIIIVPTIDLLYQTKDYLTEHLTNAELRTYDIYPWKVGQLGDGVVDPQPVTVATIRTIAKVLDVAYETYEFAEYDDTDNTKVDPKALKEWVQSIGTVVVDEAHQLGAKVLYETVTRIPAVNKFGMSASPWRDDGADLMIEAATGPPIFYVPAERLVRDGYLLAPDIRIIDTSDWWTSAAWGSVCANCGKQWLTWIKVCGCGCKTFRSQFQEAYKKEIVENSARNMRIAKEVQELDRSTLVLVKQVNHGRELASMMKDAVFLSGKDKSNTRQEAFDGIRNGNLQTLVCTQIADMGMDLPRLGALVLAGGGKSSTRHLQRIGRVVRPFPDKPKPIVLDFDDGHIANWFARHEKARRKVEKAEWGDMATWCYE